MDIDYYVLLTKAVSGKDRIERDKLYQEAHSLVAKSHLTRQAASAHVVALEDAVRRIEQDIAAAEARHEANATEAAGRMLSSGGNRRRLAVGACVLIAVMALTALLYDYVATRGTRAPDGSHIVSLRQPQRGQEDVIAADLKPGVDGGSTGADLPFSLQRQVVFYRTTVVPGSIVVDRQRRFLYLIDSNNSARRYGIGIAQECLSGASLSRITSKFEWPDRPSGAVGAKDAGNLVGGTGRLGSPLGARALLLDKPGLIIHGTNSPKTIGHLVASGCIRLVNDDVEDLYRRVSLESRVVFVS